MKNIFKVLILIASSFSMAQCSDMKVNQYNQIKFNNHLLSQITQSHADQSIVNRFFGNTLMVTSGNEPSEWKMYNSSDVELMFEDGRTELNRPNGMAYSLTILKIKTPAYSVKFNGLTVHVGYNLQVFGNNPTILTYTDGRKSVCYKIGSESLAFYLSLNNTITSIQYQYFN